MVTIRCVYDEGAIEETPLIGAKGTSFVIESEGERLLFDTGLRHRYLLHNMEHLEIGPDTIDAVAISQTHPDNCRALNGFLDARTQPVPIYCPAELREGSKGLFGKKGVSEENAQKADFRDFSGWTEVIPKVWLSPAMAYTNGYSEMFLAVASRKLAIVSGRGVAGPDVILAEAERRFERKPSVFVGSLLLAKKMKQEAARYATDLESMGVTDIYLNHCTSPEGMTQLRLKLGLKGVKEFYVGQTLEVRSAFSRWLNKLGYVWVCAMVNKLIKDMFRKVEEGITSVGTGRSEREPSQQSFGMDPPPRPAKPVAPPNLPATPQQQTPRSTPSSTPEWEGINRNLDEIPFYRINRGELRKEIRPYYVKAEKGLLNYAKSIDLGSDAYIVKDDFADLHNALMCDNPFLFYVDDQMRLTLGPTVQIVPYYRYSQAVAQDRASRMLDIAESIGRSAGRDPVAIEMAVNEYLVENVAYGDFNDSSNQYGDTALLDGHGVCKGISMAASFLLNVLGVKAGTINGYMQGGSGAGHSWNIVVIDGERYHLDVSNNHSRPNVLCYRYFNLSDDQMRRSHSWTVTTNCRDSSRAIMDGSGGTRRRTVILCTLIPARYSHAVLPEGG